MNLICVVNPRAISGSVTSGARQVSDLPCILLWVFDPKLRSETAAYNGSECRILM